MKHQIAIFLCVLLFVGCNSSKNEFSKSVNKLEKDKSKNLSAYVFYPSTIRMLSPSGDSSFYKSVKEIRKIKILKNRSEKDSIGKEVVDSFLIGIRKEKFLDMMQMQKGSQQILVFLRKSNNTPEEFIGVMHSGQDLLVIDLLGNIPASLLVSLLNGKSDFSGFGKILTINKRPQNNSNANHPRNQ